jgi:hypothetical protein
MIDTLSRIKYKETTKHTGISGKSNSRISKLTVYLHINYLYLQAPQLSDTTSPTE